MTDTEFDKRTSQRAKEMVDAGALPKRPLTWLQIIVEVAAEITVHLKYGTDKEVEDNLIEIAAIVKAYLTIVKPKGER